MVQKAGGMPSIQEEGKYPAQAITDFRNLVGRYSRGGHITYKAGGVPPTGTRRGGTIPSTYSSERFRTWVELGIRAGIYIHEAGGVSSTRRGGRIPSTGDNEFGARRVDIQEEVLYTYKAGGGHALKERDNTQHRIFEGWHGISAVLAEDEALYAYKAGGAPTVGNRRGGALPSETKGAQPFSWLCKKRKYKSINKAGGTSRTPRGGIIPSIQFDRGFGILVRLYSRERTTIHARLVGCRLLKRRDHIQHKRRENGVVWLEPRGMGGGVEKRFPIL